MSKKVENFKRRTWDSKEYERLALEREDGERTFKRVEVEGLSLDTNFAKLQYAHPNAEGPTGSQKAFLDVSQRSLDLDSKVGKFEKVEGSRQAGFHCPACDVYFQDSSSLLDHVNGREHLARLGYSLITKKATVLDVKSRLTKHTLASVNKTIIGHQSQQASSTTNSNKTFEDRVREIEQEDDPQTGRKKHRKKNKKSKEEGEEDQLPIGFASFGTS
ncbi:hypothetical protein BASA81_002752 [Batrachochytrium salamandrivorans]|nr:hypothetical protein BASA81_002752 [Batrachochytrium salamandrivorans]